MAKIPARFADMTPGTIPAGTDVPGLGKVLGSSLTAYLVARDEGAHRVERWVAFTRVHRFPPVEPLVVLR